MPLMTTLGSLAVFKLDNQYWIATIASNVSIRSVENFYVSNNKLILNTLSTGFSANSYPVLMNINNPTYNIPVFDDYIRFDSSANSIGSTSLLTNGTGNNISESNADTLINQTQLFDFSGNLLSCEVVRIFDSNNNYIANYVNPPANVSSSLSFRNSVCINTNDDGTFITSGAKRNGTGNTDSYVTNYYGNLTIQWEKEYSGVSYPGLKKVDNNTVILTNSYPFGTNFTTHNILEIDSKLGNITNQFRLTNYYNSFINLIHKEGSNHYFVLQSTAGGNTVGGVIGKITNSNAIAWQKKLDSNNWIQFGSDFYQGNFYISAYDGNNSLGKIINIDGNTGNVNWVNKITFSGSVAYLSISATSYPPLAINVQNDGMYLSWTVGNAQSNGALVFAKFPNDGSIIGNGNYSINTNLNGLINLSYSTSNVSISNSNVTIGNITTTSSNANIANSITSNIVGNTTFPYTFNSKNV